MGNYKGVKVPEILDGVIAHMRDVSESCDELAVLGQHWDLLSILGQMSGGAAEMGSTREGFTRLTGELVTQLAAETLKKAVQQITAKATVAVDIVIRNLFERTADIGFLATDDDIRAFLVNPGDPAPLVDRFKEYVAKYSVYHDVVLLDTTGRVLARINDTAAVQRSTDPLIQEALTTTAPYVEVFRGSDIFPARKTALVYAYRVTETNDPRSRALGVLCLCFRFANEMKGVFEHLVDDNDWTVLTLLDKDGKVIATSDAHQIPIAATMPLVLDEPFRVIRFAGRQYLAKTCPTHGYQGYKGLGWYGHALAPIEHVFDGDRSRASVEIEPQVLDAVMRNEQFFAPALQRIPADAEAVQQQLDRAVWNGNIRHDERATAATDTSVKVLLWEISKTGGRTRRVFERSIGNLHETVVSTFLSDVEFLAALAIDIMDRNLYERANDCRWWALTTTFRDRLAAAGAGLDRDVAAILSYINGLYTVYANLFVYDTQGIIRAVSNPEYEGLVGTAVDQPWVKATLALTSSQQYTVSPFEATELYGGRATYIYGAAIRPRSGGHPVGGIGIVFDGTPQFESMLRDALPRTGDGEVVAGSFGLFVQKNGRIVSSTTDLVAVGEHLEIDASLLGLEPGRSTSKILRWRDQYFVVGASRSQGYREYKGAGDAYREAVTSVVFVPLGNAAAVPQRHVRTESVTIRGDRRDGEMIELATFFVGGQWLGVRADVVVEAIGVERLTRVPLRNRGVAGLTIFRGKPIPVLSLTESAHDGRAAGEVQIVVLKTANGQVGLVVDALGEIPELAVDRITRIPAVLDDASYVAGVVKPAAGETWPQLLLVVDAPRLCATLVGGDAAELADQLARIAQAVDSGHRVDADSRAA